MIIIYFIDINMSEGFLPYDDNADIFFLALICWESLSSKFFSFTRNKNKTELLLWSLCQRYSVLEYRDLGCYFLLSYYSFAKTVCTNVSELKRRRNNWVNMWFLSFPIQTLRVECFVGILIFPLLCRVNLSNHVAS